MSTHFRDAALIVASRAEDDSTLLSVREIRYGWHRATRDLYVVEGLAS